MLRAFTMCDVRGTEGKARNAGREPFRSQFRMIRGGACDARITSQEVAQRESCFLPRCLLSYFFLEAGRTVFRTFATEF